jgi:hypothetical protein
MFTKQLTTQPVDQKLTDSDNLGVTEVGDSQPVRQKLASNHNQTLVSEAAISAS